MSFKLIHSVIVKRKPPARDGEFIVTNDGSANNLVRSTGRFSPKIFTAISALVVGVGVYSLFFSSASPSTTCPNLAIGECRPYDDQSPWNQPIPANVAVNPNSSTYINQIASNNLPLTSNITPKDLGCTPNLFMTNDPASAPITTRNIPTTDYTFRTYNTPYATNDSGGVPATNSTATNVPVPANVYGDDCDGQTIIWNPLTGDEWGFWFFNNVNFTAANGHKTKTTAGFNGRFGDEAAGRGGGTTYFAGLVRKWEIRQGKIEHALAFAFSSPSPNFIYPAGKSDGDGPSSAAPEGTRYQLDPTLTDQQIMAWGCTSACLTIAHALQTYGMYSIDNSGSSKIYLEAENSAKWSVTGGNADVAYVNTNKKDTPSPIPWNKFRVVATPCVATSTSNCPTTQGSTSTDTTPPTTPGTITAGTKTSSSIQFTWGASTDDVAVTGYKIYRNGAQIGTSATAGYTDSGLTSSTSYSYSVSAYDAAGNNSAQNTALAISTTAGTPTDTTPPTTTISTGSATPTNNSSTTSTNATFNFTGTDDVAVTGFECSFDAANATTGYSACTSPKIYSSTSTPSLTVGSHTFRVRAKDQAGNVDATPATITWTITAPATKPGDLNSDNSVNTTDLIIMLSKFGTTDASANLNGQGIVDTTDLIILLSKFGS